MKHIDEHTLELFILGDKKTIEDAKTITEHLGACAGCASLYDEIRSYYVEVRVEMEKIADAVQPVERASIARKRNELEPYFRHSDWKVRPYEEINTPTLWRRIGNQARAHPVVSSSFGLMLAALIAFSWSSIVKPQPQPSYYFYNTEANDVQIYSASNKLLWAMPAYDLAGCIRDEDLFNVHETQISDLYNNGRNEVITAVAPRSNQFSGNIRVYDFRGKLLRSFSFDSRSVNFRGIPYDTRFDPGQFLVEQMPDGRKDLLVSSSDGRSPTILARLTGDMKIMGKYWHYGNFKAYPIDSYHDGVREVAITGEDDISDMSDSAFDFVAILDPSKIIGNKESSVTRGFGFPASNAELYYIRLPITDIQRAQGIGPEQRILRDSNDSTLYVSIGRDFMDNSPGDWEFDFIFNLKDMKVQQVKFANPTQQTFAALKKEGKVHGTFDEQYLENLKNGVRYWNGKEWVKEATGVAGN